MVNKEAGFIFLDSCDRSIGVRVLSSGSYIVLKINVINKEDSFIFLGDIMRSIGECYDFVHVVGWIRIVDIIEFPGMLYFYLPSRAITHSLWYLISIELYIQLYSTIYFWKIRDIEYIICRSFDLFLCWLVWHLSQTLIGLLRLVDFKENNEPTDYDSKQRAFALFDDVIEFFSFIAVLNWTTFGLLLKPSRLQNTWEE